MVKHTDDPTKNCKVTFIIGNGFDLNLGLKTKYTDMYEGYIKEPSIIGYIDEFKKTLQNQIPYEKWGDFELGMAKHAKNFSSEKQLIECVRDFKRYLVNYLKGEENKLEETLSNITNTMPINMELDNSFKHFYSGLIPNDARVIESIMNNKMIDVNIITFNYTDCMERLLDYGSRPFVLTTHSPIHIHGKLNEDVVLGADNLAQLNEIPYTLTKKGKRAFLKPEFNERYDTKRLDDTVNTLYASDIICTYGFSMGETDKMWVDIIIDWLMESPSHHLICFQYDETEYHRYNSDEIMDAEDEKKIELLKRFGKENEELLNQIHIPIGYSIFNLKNAIFKSSKDSVEFDPKKTYENKTYALNGAS